MSILEIKDLVKKFDGVRAVDNISIGFEKGKITSIIGPNGSGKTTLINMLSGMARMDGGVVAISGRTFTRIERHRVSSYGITRTFQDIRVFEQMTVLDNMLVITTKRSVWEAFFERHDIEHLKKTEEALRRVGLWEKRSTLAYNLSYGQRRLLEIARVLVMIHSIKLEQNNAEGSASTIILFDEPFSGLFKEMIAVIVSIINELRARNITILLIEHNMDIIRALSDYVMVMDNGQLFAEGKPDEVLARPDVIEAYLGE